MTVLRPAESSLLRVLAGSAGLFRGDDYPQRLAEAAAGTQLPVTTGRRIAVVGSRGGAGKTTAAALLARVYAALRADAVAAVDNAPESGTLGFRMGVPGAPSLDAVAARCGPAAPDSLRELAALLTVAGQANLLVTGRRRPRSWTVVGSGAGTARVRPVPAAWVPPGPAASGPGCRPDGTGKTDNGERTDNGEKTDNGPDDAAASLLRIISRYCSVTLFDCGPGLGDPDARRVLAQAHLALFVTPASASGLADAAEYASGWELDPLLGGVPLLVLVVQSDRDSGFNAAREAGKLRRSGIGAASLGYDRHLAAGLEVDPARCSRRTRLEAASLASRVLSAAVAAPAAAPAAAARLPRRASA